MLHYIPLVHPCDKDDNGGCTQECIKGEGKELTCECIEGYELGEDGKSCSKSMFFLMCISNSVSLISATIGNEKLNIFQNMMVIAL